MSQPPFTPIVTFIGSKPGTRFGTGRPDQPPPPGPGDQTPTIPAFLGEVYDALLEKKGVVPTGLPGESLTDPPMHMLVRVADLAQVGEWLSAYFTQHTAAQDKLRVQFVGHSVSGALSLGGTWITDQNEQFSSPYYVLNSNPRALTELSLYLGRIEQVMLAGCYIGSRLSNGDPVNGRTLLFTLAEMWHCEVRGANTSVAPNDFEERGWYTNKQIPAIGWAWHRRDDATRVGTDDSRTLVLKKQGLSTPTSISAGKLVIDDPREISIFCSYFDSELADAAKPNLGVSEFAIRLHYDHTHSAHSIDAYFTCNGQFLVVASGAAPTFYAHSQNVVSTEVSRLVTRLRAATERARYRSTSPATR